HTRSGPRLSAHFAGTLAVIENASSGVVTFSARLPSFFQKTAKRSPMVTQFHTWGFAGLGKQCGAQALRARRADQRLIRRPEKVSHSRSSITTAERRARFLSATGSKCWLLGRHQPQSPPAGGAPQESVMLQIGLHVPAWHESPSQQSGSVSEPHGAPPG